MNNQPSWFSKFFSAEFSESSKRLGFIVLIGVFIIQFFLVMYIRVEIANKDIVAKNILYLVILILVLGTYITTEMIGRYFDKKATLQADVDTAKANAGVSDVQVTQEVKEQNIVTDVKKTAIKRKP